MGDSADTARERQKSKKPRPLPKLSAARAFGAKTSIFVPPELQDIGVKPLPKRSVMLKPKIQTLSDIEAQRDSQTRARERMRVGLQINTPTGANDIRAVPTHTTKQAHQLDIIRERGVEFMQLYGATKGAAARTRLINQSDLSAAEKKQLRAEVQADLHRKGTSFTDIASGIAGGTESVLKGLGPVAGFLNPNPGRLDPRRGRGEVTPKDTFGPAIGAAKGVGAAAEEMLKPFAEFLTPNPAGLNPRRTGARDMRTPADLKRKVEAMSDQLVGKSITNLVAGGDVPRSGMQAAGLGAGIFFILPQTRLLRFVGIGKKLKLSGIGEALPDTPERNAAKAAIAQRVGEEDANYILLATDNIARQAAAATHAEVAHIVEPNDWYKGVDFHATNWADFKQRLDKGQVHFQITPGERRGLVRGRADVDIVDTRDPQTYDEGIGAVIRGKKLTYTVDEGEGVLVRYTMEKAGADQYVVKNEADEVVKTLKQNEIQAEINTSAARWTGEKVITPHKPDAVWVKHNPKAAMKRLLKGDMLNIETAHPQDYAAGVVRVKKWELERTGPDSFVLTQEGGHYPENFTMAQAREFVHDSIVRKIHTLDAGAADTAVKENPLWYSNLSEKVDSEISHEGATAEEIIKQLRGKPLSKKGEEILDAEGGLTYDEQKMKSAEWRESGMDDFLASYPEGEVIPKADIQHHLATGLNAYDMDEVIRESFGMGPNERYWDLDRNPFKARWHEYAEGGMVVKTPTRDEPYYEIVMKLRRPLTQRIKNTGTGFIKDIVSYGHQAKGHLHWTADNDDVWGHVRFHVITDNEGKKALLIEEVQSDWNAEWQAYIKKYGGPENVQDALDDINRQIDLANADVQIAGSAGMSDHDLMEMDNQIEKLYEKRGEISYYQQNIHGAAPLGTKQAEQIVKRTLRFAQEANVDRVIVIQGDVQAVRNLALGRVKKLKPADQTALDSLDRQIATAEQSPNPDTSQIERLKEEREKLIRINVHDAAPSRWNPESLEKWKYGMSDMTHEEVKAWVNDPENWKGGIAETFFRIYGGHELHPVGMVNKIFEKKMGEKGRIIKGIFNGGYADESMTIRRVPENTPNFWNGHHWMDDEDYNRPLLMGTTVKVDQGYGQIFRVSDLPHGGKKVEVRIGGETYTHPASRVRVQKHDPLGARRYEYDGKRYTPDPQEPMWRPEAGDVVMTEDGPGVVVSAEARVVRTDRGTHTIPTGWGTWRPMREVREYGERPMDGYVIEMTDGAKEKAASVEALYQKQDWNAIPNGATEFFSDGRRAIHLFEGTNVSTIFHELAHVALADMSPTDRAILMRHFGNFKTTADHEAYARSMERYLYDGKAMASALDPVYEKVQEWMKGVYTHVNQIGGNPSPEVEQVFNRLLIQAETPAQQLVRLLKTAPGIRKAQEIGYSEERSKRIAALMETWDANAEGGLDAYFLAKGELKGMLPREGYNALDDLPDEAVASLLDIIRTHPDARGFEKVRAVDAILKAKAGSVPTMSELKLLREIFGDVADWKSVKKGGFGRLLLNVWNIPRSISASIDLSAPGRQAMVAGFRHPNTFRKNFKPMIKAARPGQKGAEYAKDVAEDIATRPTFGHMHRARLAIDTSAGDPLIAAHEEQFASEYADKIPGVKHSARAYETFLHKMRADIFDDMLEKAARRGVDIDNEDFLIGLGRHINSITGRGAMWDNQLVSVENAAPFFNMLFFSPRLLASRGNLLSPRYYYKLQQADPSGFLLQQAAKSTVATVAGLTTILGVGSMIAGVSLGLDPTSANFAKLRIGDTRVDLLAGFSPLIVLAVREVFGYSTSSSSGKRQNLKGGFGESSRKDIGYRFLESKFAPTPGIIRDLSDASTFIGGPVNWKSVGANFVPMTMRDIYETQKEPTDPTERAAAAAVVGLFATFGIGFSSYPDKRPSSGRRSSDKPDPDDPFQPDTGDSGGGDWFAPDETTAGGGGGAGDWFAP